MTRDLTPSEPPARPTCPELSQGLSWLLEHEPNETRALDEIAKAPVLQAEIRKALPALRWWAAAPAGEAGVQAVIGPRFALFPQPDRSDGEWAAWWADYYDVLAGVPYSSLEAAMAAYVKQPDAEFMPKPGRLLELAKSTPNRAAKVYGRALKAANNQVERPPASEEQRAAVGKMLGEFFAHLDAKKAERVVAPLPAIHGKPDASGITPQLRAILARQREG